MVRVLQDVDAKINIEFWPMQMSLVMEFRIKDIWNLSVLKKWIFLES